MKRVENMETLDHFGRKIELKLDYEIDISKSSYEDWLKKKELNVSSSSSNEQNDDLSISKEEESSKSHELIDTENMENAENVVASEIEVDHKTNLLQFSEDEIYKHYANLATHIIAAFSKEFKSKECVKRLKKILKLLEEDKDEVFKSKAGNDNSEKGDIVEEEHKNEDERVEAECKEAEKMEAEHEKEAESVEAQCEKEAESVKAECKKEAERVEAECKEADKVEAEHKNKAQRVEAEHEKEAERVEAERKTGEEHKKVYLELCKENPVD